MIPDFDKHGALPPGIHPATMDEIEGRFGRATEVRQAQVESLRWLFEAAKNAGVLRIIVDGSFATDRLEPNDVDCALMLGGDFAAELGAEIVELMAIPFLHVLVFDANGFEKAVERLFGTDRWGDRKGMIEVESWN